MDALDESIRPTGGGPERKKGAQPEDARLSGVQEVLQLRAKAGGDVGWEVVAEAIRGRAAPGYPRGASPATNAPSAATKSPNGKTANRNRYAISADSPETSCSRTPSMSRRRTPMDSFGAVRFRLAFGVDGGTGRVGWVNRHRPRIAPLHRRGPHCAGCSRLHQRHTSNRRPVERPRSLCLSPGG